MPGHGEGPLPGLVEATASIEQHSRQQRIWRKLRFAVLGTGLLLLLIELGLRSFGSLPVDLIPADAQLLQELGASGFFRALPESEGRYGLQPGARAELGGVEYQVSNQATRGADFEGSKPTAEKRLLVLGAGLAMGLGIRLEATPAESLAALANAASSSGSSWRGISLAVPGHGFPQQASELEQRGLNFEPDLVLAYFQEQPLVDSGYFLDAQGQLQRDRIPLPSVLRTWLWKSRLYAHLASMYRQSQELSFKTPTARSADWVRGSSDAESKAGLERIEILCREAGVPFRRLDPGPDSASSYALLQAEGLLP